MGCYRFEAAGGMAEVQYAMKMFSCGFRTIGDIRVGEVIDHRRESDGSPEAGSVEYRLEGGCVVLIKPSGTEPVLEVSISSADESSDAADSEKRICSDIESILNMDYRAGYCCE